MLVLRLCVYCVCWVVCCAEGESFDFEHLRKLSAGFTRPVVFRGMAKDLPILEKWNDPNYFMNNPKYADTEVLVVQNAKLHQQWYGFLR